jgi:hypothetical protein
MPVNRKTGIEHFGDSILLPKVEAQSSSPPMGAAENTHDKKKKLRRSWRK